MPGKLVPLAATASGSATSTGGQAGMSCEAGGKRVDRSDNPALEIERADAGGTQLAIYNDLGGSAGPVMRFDWRRIPSGRNPEHVVNSARLRTGAPNS